MTPEDWGNRLAGLQKVIWAAEWMLRDECLELVTQHPEWIRGAALIMDTSRRNIEEWAAQAKATPPDQRDAFHSVQHHNRWARKEGRLKTRAERFPRPV